MQLHGLSSSLFDAGTGWPVGAGQCDQDPLTSSAACVFGQVKGVLRDALPATEQRVNTAKSPDEQLARVSNGSRAEQDMGMTTLARVGDAGPAVPTGAAPFIVVGPVLAPRSALASRQQTGPLTVPVAASASARAHG